MLTILGIPCTSHKHFQALSTHRFKEHSSERMIQWNFKDFDGSGGYKRSGGRRQLREGGAMLLPYHVQCGAEI
jgi:hypothetical protein